ncbi:hypothetical protein E2C01_090098 [Portunus trituberculatus]|uniref:Uncharacterized protein n=1 Tax=Portunus trituberculatus TaxID=210409 RepID=A0A5B7JP67_PORTR|nr:hypothetical protein [Portunus trituberculatus]
MATTPLTAGISMLGKRILKGDKGRTKDLQAAAHPLVFMGVFVESCTNSKENERHNSDTIASITPGPSSLPTPLQPSPSPYLPLHHVDFPPTSASPHHSYPHHKPLSTHLQVYLRPRQHHLTIVTLTTSLCLSTSTSILAHLSITSPRPRRSQGLPRGSNRWLGISSELRSNPHTRPLRHLPPPSLLSFLSLTPLSSVPVTPEKKQTTMTHPVPASR